MTDEEAIDFLKTVQPMPDDSALSEELIRRFDEVRTHFVASPNERAVPLLLNSFGNGNGLGVYQLVEDAIFGVTASTVVPYLIEALASPHSSVRYWVSQISANYDDERLIPPLLALLSDKSVDTRLAALVSIEKYVGVVNKELERLRRDERSAYVKKMYDDILSSIR